MTNSQAQQRLSDQQAQLSEEEKAAYAAGYSEGYASGLILELRFPAVLIPAGLEHPAYLSGYADGKTDGAATCLAAG